jgi:RNA polymerase sigma factor (sigma-70 family)
MTPRRLAPALRHLRHLLARPDTDAVPDAQLLQRFVSRRDEAAFELLIGRHGPMVLGVCRRVLGDAHDAEDAFQATLLVLARKAGSIGRRGSVGSWLYQVAYRVALRARAGALRRARHERRVADLPAVADPHAAADPGWRELRPVLDEELGRLPEKYRAPVVLCYLEGLTNEQAARQLRCPAGTLKTRLTRARRLLADRLARRGLAPGAGLLAAAALRPAASAAVPAALVGPTARAAALVAAGKVTAAGVVSAQAARLTEGVLRAMVLMKVKLAAVALVAGLAAAGAGVGSYRALAAGTATQGRDGRGPAPAPEGGAAQVERLRKRIAALQDELRSAEQAAAREKSAAARRQPVAYIFQDVAITREELGDYLIARMGPDRLEALINRRILEHACRQKGITATEAEVEAALGEDIQALRRHGQDFAAVLRQRGQTLRGWREDVIKPRLLLAKLCRGRVRVTEKDVRNAFEARYGEKVECQMILWPRGEREQAERTYEVIRTDGRQFQLAAGTQPTPALARADGHIPPVGRHSTGSEGLEEAAFRLREGEVSPLLDTPQGLLVVKCIRRLPADTSRRLEEEREQLRREVLDGLLQKEMGKALRELREQARPRVLWKPEGGVRGTSP